MTGQFDNVPDKRKPPSFAWVIVLGPTLLIVVLFIFQGLPWVEDQSAKGALYEASSNNTLGEMAMKNGEYRKAYSQFMGAIQIKEDYVEPYGNLGILHHLMAKDARAKNKSSQAAQMDAKAIEYFNTAINLGSKKREMIYNNLGMVYASEAKYDTAETMFRRALELGIDPAPIWRNIGSVKVATEDWHGAIESYQMAINARPNLENQYMEMIRNAIYMPENEDYIQTVSEISENGVDDATLRHYDEQVVDVFLNRNESLAKDYKDLAIAYEKSGDLNKALANLRKALEIRPKWAAIYNRIGSIYARNGYYKEAMAEFEKALTVDPRNKNALENLSNIKGRIQP